MEYDKLLDRARGQLPEKVFEKSRFEIPKILSVIEGNKTFITNIREVLSTINRDENHFLKFMAGELATSVVMEGARAVFAGKHAKVTLQTLLERYVKEYVMCGECDKPDTSFVIETRIMRKRCDACGASTAVKPLRK
ncbi:MAG: translation initiation factor IF-2 subunit beta [Candidatus Heimdallarchaeota archaeon]|nr:translation initiation factor IF-2 subunit beta [Candidatus Heimdallarchaeota archaeon]MCK4769157.1 translation initiation factor IF-2 subunit beta [Candidatus Heimdallarchaeota archaeon]